MYLHALGNLMSGPRDLWVPRAQVWLQAVTSHLSHRVGQRLNNLLVCGGHHALPIDLDDAVADADTAPLRDAPTHEAADLSDTGGVGVSRQLSVPAQPASLLLPPKVRRINHRKDEALRTDAPTNALLTHKLRD